ncbi:MAG: hypothetical protein COW16_07125 [Sphingomonadales bacterium CG12_big_fil_rev_8_21_14_0_65_65_10]|nr:MAG: hypothetical protein COW16_07125 [Sphingomonadales bacterium CG12_big_fil_rev_8_21_14_0_65_65_10]
MRRTGLWQKIKTAQTNSWLQALGGERSAFNEAAAELLDPGRREVQRMSDDDLTAIIEERPGTRLSTLAQSELKVRESWRGPARWSLLISLLAFILSMVAFFRTI